ncbi:dopamine beta-hydroxylase isoform X1 [Nerophis ophidion]|uniref:dopamine beta-hydroxylase isoform X1 n=1 Tax=Nerophis ophidion TaxID=159077 RepID=UPI002ADFFEF2|nr:dopamine beta-hydroxylase isoform X1 [Nerophis ophidion]
MRIRDLRLRDLTVMYFTALAALTVILVASYQAPAAVAVVDLVAGTAAERAPALPMPFRVPLDPLGELRLAWNVSYERQEVTLELRAAHMQHGVLLGMSDRGQLTRADLVVLWEAGGKSYFGDAWSDSEGHVTLDRQQDYQLMEARRTSEGFYLLFKRLFNTCDPRDYLIQEGTVHVIYALLDQPLASLEQLNLSGIHTGLQRVLMLRPDTPPPTLPPDVRTLDVVAPDVLIPGQETTYWCSVHRLPEGMAKNHIVMYESVITAGNEAIVHHMEVFECSPDMSNVPDYSGSCDDKMKPSKLNFCRHVLAAWAMGAEAFYYPPHAGLPVGGHAASRFLRLEVHYHNPLRIAGRRDSSGIRLHLTPSLRRYDAGIMELGLVYTPIMAVPPQQHTFYLSGYCTSDCTRTVRTRAPLASSSITYRLLLGSTTRGRLHICIAAAHPPGGQRGAHRPGEGGQGGGGGAGGHTLQYTLPEHPSPEEDSPGSTGRRPHNQVHLQHLGQGQAYCGRLWHHGGNVCQLRALLPTHAPGSLQESPGPGTPAEVLHLHYKIPRPGVVCVWRGQRDRPVFPPEVGQVLHSGPGLAVHHGTHLHALQPIYRTPLPWSLGQAAAASRDLGPAETSLPM